jgi:hypothetical protein
MLIGIDAKLEAVLRETALQQRLSPGLVAINALRERFLGEPPLLPRDDWERALLSMGTDWGVSLSNEQLSSEGIYD